MKSIHLIAGLPRSGSTLLSAILLQNPRFRAAMSSPLAPLCSAIVQKLGRGTEFGMFFNDQRRLKILQGVVENYYFDSPSDVTVFDTNRGWTSLLPLVAKVLPNAKVICCVRDVSWIIDSIERLIAENPLQPNRIFGNKVGGTVYSRVDKLMNSETGLVGLPWASLREAWFGTFSEKLLFIEYDALARRPQQSLEKLYAFLGEPTFQHDFSDVRYEADAYDAELGIEGLHRVRPTVSFVERETCLPPDLFKKYAEANFWINDKLNLKNVARVSF